MSTASPQIVSSDAPTSKVVVLFGSGRKGGFHVRTRRMLWSLYERIPDQRFALFVPKGDALASADLPPSVTVYETAFAGCSMIHRVLWLHFILPWHCARLHAKAVLGLACYGPLWAPCERLVFVNNGRLVSPLFQRLNNLSFRGRFVVRLQRFFLGISLRRARRIGVQRPGMIEDIRTHWKIPPKRFILAPNSTSLGESNVSPRETSSPRERFRDAFLILCPTLYARHKNLELVIPAMEKLLAERNDARRIVVLLTLDALSPGHEPGAASLVRRIKESPASENFHLLGEVPHAQMASLFDEVDAILYPSVADSFSVVFLDAMARGRPILAADVPHAREVCGPAAEYFQWDDPASLATAIDHVASDTEHREALVVSGRMRAETFTHEVEISGMIQLLYGSEKTS